MTRETVARSAASLGLALALLGAPLAMAAPPEAGSTLADLALPTLDDTQRILSQRDGPTVLIFFRGVW